MFGFKKIKKNLNIAERYKSLYERADAQRDEVVQLLDQLNGMYQSQKRVVKLLRGELRVAQMVAARQSGVVNTQFDQEDIRKLISLCHPDKHGGKQSAQEITQKLLQLRHTVQ